MLYYPLHLQYLRTCKTFSMTTLKTLLTVGSFITVLAVSAQNNSQNWFNLDQKKDKVYGISTELTYQTLLKGKTSKPIIVAIIDGGTEIDHPDLKANAWVNQNEIPGNGIDDDKNGYIDDVNGWNFIGGKNGTVQYDNLELTRLYRDAKVMVENYSASNQNSSAKTTYDNLKTVYEQRTAEMKKQYPFYKNLWEGMLAIEKGIGKEDYSKEELEKFTTDNSQVALTQKLLLSAMSKGASLAQLREEVKGAYDYFYAQAEYHYNLDYDCRSIVGDDYRKSEEKYYGNTDIEGPDGLHGTHVAGIVGAVRNNNLGMDGVAENVKLMTVRVVPNGDERDKDVANGIRYAVDNGARVINMSFGKGYSYNKKIVDEAVKYAVSKGVLLVHAAGNDGQNNDESNNFPNDTYEDGSGVASNWIEVGASEPDGHPASFSNYGKKNVDVFAPGTEIYSTIPDGKYANEQGTSMASPVTAGAAALILSYYPELSASQVKDILIQTVTPVKGKVRKPGSKGKTKYKKICVSGGIINTYKAIEMAQKMTGK